MVAALRNSGLFCRRYSASPVGTTKYGVLVVGSLGGTSIRPPGLISGHRYPLRSAMRLETVSLMTWLDR